MKSKIVKQYFIEVDSCGKTLTVLWAPLVWDMTTRGFKFTGTFSGGGIPNYTRVTE